MRRLSAVFLLGDIILFYLSLFLALLVRYSGTIAIPFAEHFALFTPIFILWLGVFVVFKLDEPEMFVGQRDFARRLFVAVGINAFVATAIFYFLPLPLSPKTNLLITSAFYFLLVLGWHTLLGRTFYGRDKLDVILVGDPARYAQFFADVERSPQMNIRVLGAFRLENMNWELVDAKKSNQVFVFEKGIDAREAASAIFRHIGPERPVFRLIDFYGEQFGRIPIEEMTEEFVLTELSRRAGSESRMRRLLDIILCAAVFLVVAPLSPLIAIGIFLSSPGPIFFAQERVGFLGKPFTVHKFRTMHREGTPQWSSAKDDRVFLFGRILRALHLDEIPQVISILKGDMSIVGPRPEQVPIVKELEATVPFYQLRHLVKPGVTGWAQLQFRYAASVEESKTKLEYDLYYIKHRSVLFDLLIILKTMGLFGKEFSR